MNKITKINENHVGHKSVYFSPVNCFEFEQLDLATTYLTSQSLRGWTVKIEQNPITKTYTVYWGA